MKYYEKNEQAKLLWICLFAKAMKVKQNEKSMIM